jgi:uncharacterized membrane protein YqaE (UPF0057 family)
MKQQLTKTLLIICLGSFIFSSTAFAADNNTKTTSSEKSTKNEKKVEKTTKSKEVKKLTLKQKFKLIKQFRKERKKLRKMGVKSDAPMILLYILAVLLPPVAVGIYTDWEAKPTLIDLLLTLIFWIPGIVYAFYILLS